MHRVKNNRKLKQDENYDKTSLYTEWARKVSLLTATITLSILPTNFQNVWNIYTIEKVCKWRIYS